MDEEPIIQWWNGMIWWCKGLLAEAFTARFPTKKCYVVLNSDYYRVITWREKISLFVRDTACGPSEEFRAYLQPYGPYLQELAELGVDLERVYDRYEFVFRFL